MDADSRGGMWIGRVLIALCCGLPLFQSYLPMRELPQYAALSRMLVHLGDPAYGFGGYYELDLWRGASVLPLWLWGVLADCVGIQVASRVMACASVWLVQSGIWAVLSGQGKPWWLALLGVPFAYGGAFYQGLVPSGVSVGLGFWGIALVSRDSSPLTLRLRWCLFALGVALPLTHPLGVGLVLLYVGCLAVVQLRAWRSRVAALWPLAPLLLGALYWCRAALHADGVAALQFPSLALRILRAPHVLLGGFQGQGEAWLLVAALVCWVYLCRPLLSDPRHLRLPLTAANWLFALVCLLGYVGLPASTWTTAAIYPRAGSVLLAWLPVLVPNGALGAARRRAPALLIALALSSIWYTREQLERFSVEASALSTVLARVPERAKLLCLTYDNQGQVARSNPYLHACAYAQAERGGFLALSRVDYGWTVPLRRRKAAVAPPPAYGSEWDPTLVQRDPGLLAFYDTVLVIGKEPREMTILMNTPYRLVARRGVFMLYTRAPI
mgnify:FL=1